MDSVLVRCGEEGAELRGDQNELAPQGKLTLPLELGEKFIYPGETSSRATAPL